MNATENAHATDTYPSRETIPEPPALDNAPEPRADDPTLVGAFGEDAEAEITTAAAVEADLLYTLMWAPAHIARQVVDILLDAVATGSPRPVRLVSGLHEAVLTAIGAVLDTGAAPAPSLVMEQLRLAGMYRQTEASGFLNLATSRGLPSTDFLLPYLAAQVLDSHYRRGYRTLLSTMAQAQQELPIEELAGTWTRLTEHQQRAESDWLTRRDQLAHLH